MSLNKEFTSVYCHVGPKTFRVMTDHFNGEDLLNIVFASSPVDSPAVGLRIKDVAALHAILGNWLKKRDRRNGRTGDRRVGIPHGRRIVGNNSTGGIARKIPASLERRATLHVPMSTWGRRATATTGRRKGDVR